MTEYNATSDNGTSTEDTACNYLHFGLIVTGKSEQEHLPKLFKSLLATGICTFEVIGFIGQRGPITSEKRKLKMVGAGKIIPDKDADEIGFPTRTYLKTGDCHFVVLIDDLEHDRQTQVQQVFERYRTAFDTILTDDQKRRAVAHFLVNMLEAYYFADAQAINKALDLNPPISDHAGDVETIRNPKSELKKLYQDFDQIEDGGRILDLLNVEHVLSKSDSCAWLRTLFAWCVKILERPPYYESLSLSDKFCLHDGILSDITKTQLDNL